MYTELRIQAYSRYRQLPLNTWLPQPGVSETLWLSLWMFSWKCKFPWPTESTILTPPSQPSPQPIYLCFQQVMLSKSQHRLFFSISWTIFYTQTPAYEGESSLSRRSSDLRKLDNGLQPIKRMVQLVSLIQLWATVASWASLTWCW